MNLPLNDTTLDVYQCCTVPTCQNTFFVEVSCVPYSHWSLSRICFQIIGNIPLCVDSKSRNDLDVVLSAVTCEYNNCSNYGYSLWSVI